MLEYLSDSALRRSIHGATIKCERFNKFTKWPTFGGNETISENDRDKQRKVIKYNYLVAHCLIFHNVQSNELNSPRTVIGKGGILTTRSCYASPYLTRHVNRFGIPFGHESTFRVFEVCSLSCLGSRWQLIAQESTHLMQLVCEWPEISFFIAMDLHARTGFPSATRCCLRKLLIYLRLGGLNGVPFAHEPNKSPTIKW